MPENTQSYNKPFDAAVVGGGHAGLEAAIALAKNGLQTILITQSIDAICRLSCNPSIGGIAKGNIVREIDALGGEMGHLADSAMIQFRLLNRSKGPAVQAPRTQADKIMYAINARHLLEKTKNLTLLQDTVTEIITTPCNNREKIEAIKTQRGRHILLRTLVLTTGTFLGGKIFIGNYEENCGRLGEMAAQGLTDSLIKHGFTVGRLKTGTPVRILKKSIDFSKLEIQNGDSEIIPFSFDTPSLSPREMHPCYLAYTNEKTHEIIRNSIHLSPLYSGKISGVGPRYCPSIEDKVMRFCERERHQLFLEPEGLQTDEMYLNGLSSSLPEEVQDSFVRTIPGFENAIISRPGYAVEYDFIDPTQLHSSLETHKIAGLFTAGQINGTSGYEEAAGQGLIAGINASRYAKAHIKQCGNILPTHKDSIHTIPSYDPLILTRDEAYIGVLIDDLVTLGTKEPYRMFTARAEYRLKLRHDTANERLCKKGFEAGLKTQQQLDTVHKIIETKKNLLFLFENQPHIATLSFLEAKQKKDISCTQEEWDAAQLDFKYKFYIEKQDKRIEKMHKMEKTKIPTDFDYTKILSLSAESRQKLEQIRPHTLGQAGRISGIRNSDIMLLMTHLL